MNYKELTSPCGIDCFNCELFEKNVSKPLQENLAQIMGVPSEVVKCQGCRISGCFMLPKGCAAKNCIAEKGVDFCYKCDEFPCTKLHPCVDGSTTYPQNFKLYNLCRIKNVGLEKWAKEEAKEIRRRYHTGKIVIGAGPKIIE